MSNAESSTMRRLLDKVASLSQPQLVRATDALSMIWSGAAMPLHSPAQESNSNLATNSAQVANLHRAEFALLKSISTGTFIDVQLYAYNAISDDLPLDPKPLFTSSIVIGELGSAIATRKLKRGSQRATV